MTDDTEIRVSRLVDAPAAAIFDVLTNPDKHVQTDASGMVVSAEKAQRIQQVGDVFRMNMLFNRNGRNDPYQVDNHVTGYAENRLVAWRPGLPDAEAFGWEWLYELQPEGSDATTVSLAYRWGDCSPETVSKFHLPAFDADALEASLARLAEAVSA